MSAPINLTAALVRADDGRDVILDGHDRAATALPSAARARGRAEHIDELLLLFVHGHRHREEWSLHAEALRIACTDAGGADFCRRSHVLMYVNDVHAPRGLLLRMLKGYPQRTRLLIAHGANTGYRCGLLHNLASTEHIWRGYPSVLFTHPDVYLFPPAPQRLLERVAAIAGADWHYPTPYASPTPLPDSPIGSSWPRHNVSGVGLLATSTTMFWSRNKRPSAFLSDLFLFRPNAMRRAWRHAHRARCTPPDGKWSILSGRPSDVTRQQRTSAWCAESTSFFSNASRDCATAYNEGRGLLKPEMALYAAASYAHVAVEPLVTRSSGWMLRRVSQAGVWHSHNTSEVRNAVRLRAAAPAAG